MSHGRGARWAVGTAILAALALSLPLLVALLDPRRDREDPVAQEERASSALAAARVAGAARHAPANLARAEEAYANGLLARRRQQFRFRIMRDYRAADALLAEAAEAADRASSLAESARRKERARGDDALDEAVATLAKLIGVEDRLWLPADVRARLQRARALATQGSALAADGAYAAAAERAAAAGASARDVSRSVWSATARYTEEGRLDDWRAWAAETIAWSSRTGKAAIVVDKDEHRLTLYRGGRAIRRYDVELGWNNASDKRRQGDGATPEGRYKIVQLKGRGRSRYHRALLLDYPNPDDLRTLAALKRAGAVRAGTGAGALIEIHGAGGRGKDWTDGCVAVTDAEIEELYTQVGVGTPVTIVGSTTGAGVFATLARSVQR